MANTMAIREQIKRSSMIKGRETLDPRVKPEDDDERRSDGVNISIFHTI